MARIRTIKPEFWESEKVGRMSVLARLSFVGLISLADDEGRGRGSLSWLRSRLHPYAADVPIGSVEFRDALGEIEMAGLVYFYEPDDDGCTYYTIPGWSDNQRIDRPKSSNLPDPPEFDEPSSIYRRSVDDASSKKVVGREGKGREGKGYTSSSATAERRPVPPLKDPKQKTAKVVWTNPEPVNGEVPDWTMQDVVDTVFAEWQEHCEHPRAKLDPKRRRAIEKGVTLGFTPLEMVEAVRGYGKSDFHMGRDPKSNGKKYTDLSLIFRDADHVEAGLEYARGERGRRR